jgi:hypothetical protein
MSPDWVTGLTDALIELFYPLVQAIEDVDSATALLRNLGYQPPSDVQFLNDFSPLLTALIDFADQTDDLLRGDTEPDYLALFRSLIDAIRDIVKLIRDTAPILQKNFSADFLSATAIAEHFPRQLADYLLVRMIERRYPVLHSSLLMIGLIDEGDVITAATPFNIPYKKKVIRWEDLGDYLNKPLVSMQGAYGWTADDFDYSGLIRNVILFGQSVGLFTCSSNPEPGVLQALNNSNDVVTDDNAYSLAILKFPLLPLSPSPVGFEVYPVLTPAKDKTAGFGLGFYFDPSGGLNYAITDNLNLGLQYTGTAPLDAGIVILPNQALQLVNNVFSSSGPQVDLSTFIPEFSYMSTGQKTLLFDTSFGAKFEFASWALRTGVLAALSGVYVETDLKGATLTLSASQGDGFLQSILPSQPMALDFDLTIGFSSTTGLYFGGSAHLDVKLPTHISIGPITVQGITVSLKPAGGKIPIALGADITLSVGPVGVTVQSMGATVILSFPPNRDGNAGPMQIDLGFQPPDGAGLSVNSAGVSGGGFLAHDAAKQEYSGVLQLKFNDLALQAFGLITTQVAGGSGYSLLALIDADFPPIQLGWGFTLNGVGGLLAVHRTASVDALRAAVKSGKISSILFPTSPITNASQILGTLDTLFPTAPGRFLFGPMALIGWGTPTVLTASVAVIIELPEPIEIILLAKLTAQLPTPKAPLVKLNMDALGVLDLTQDDLSLDASLFDSKLISFPITGDMALRANWSSQREFLLAIGGFHPQFTPPSDFPSLNRVTISMPSGVVSKLRLAAYLALTSNSVQFGATLDVFIGISDCGISGHLGFDALLQLKPFHFTADISGSVAITIGGDDLASVSLDATLSGPAPWNIAGNFKIHIIFFDVHKSFSETWGLSAPSQQTSTIDVGALLNTALADPRNWSSQLPAGVSALVTTRQIDDATSVFAHPLALLEVHEQIVPLGLAITHFGEAVPSGATEFSITDFRVGNQTVLHTAVQDDFAPAQFFDLSDSDKLSRPSFERHDAGALMSDNNPGTNSTSFPKTVTMGTLFAKTIDYESFFINTPGVVTVDEGVPQAFPWDGLPIVMRTGSAALKAISQAGKLRYAAPGNPITVAEPVFTVASTGTLIAATTSAAAGTTYSDAAVALKSALATSPALRDQLQIVASHELTKVAA